MKNHPLLIAATFICSMVLSFAFCFGEEKTIPSLGQTILKGEKSVVLRFGIHVDKAERLLGAKSVPVSWYKPEGIVKEIVYAGLKLHFEREKLETITYLDDFNFSLQISPFGDTVFNPPALRDHPLKSRMTVEEFLAVAKAWKASLTEAGYTEATGPGQPKNPGPMQFSGQYNALRARHYYYFEIGPSPKSPDESRCKKLAIWSIEFTLDDKLESLSAVDTIYSVPFVFQKK